MIKGDPTYPKTLTDCELDRCDNCLRIHVFPGIILLPGILYARDPGI